jgi:hypothetical protein
MRKCQQGDFFARSRGSRNGERQRPFPSASALAGGAPSFAFGVPGAAGTLASLCLVKHFATAVFCSSLLAVCARRQLSPHWRWPVVKRIRQTALEVAGGETPVPPFAAPFADVAFAGTAGTTGDFALS